jgi:glutamate-1-semialdehyde 2,1-aminomutase
MEELAMPSIVERYAQKFRTSGEMYKRGAEVVAGGGHQSRTVLPHPVYVDEARGALKWDVDGNELVDHMIGYGALLLGHGHPAVTDAVTARIAKGTHMGTISPLEIRWAELVTNLIPSADLVRFTGSGTESTLLAMRLARGFTGKTKVVKFREHFHGWHDYASPQSGINTQVGIPGETMSTVIVVEPDLAEVEKLFDRDDDIAAIILEPTGGHWGQFPLPNPGFLHELRALATRSGVVMIMDEVICGFRMSKGGAQQRFDVKPDLTTMAKIVAGGLPGGAVGGKAEIMGLLGSSDPSMRLAHPGTFNANPVSAAAGIAMLETIQSEPVIEKADAAATRLKAGLRDALTKMEVTGHVHGIASIVHVALGVECTCPGDICTQPHSALAEATSAPRSEMLKLAMLNEGVDMMGGIGFLTSAAHRDKDIDRTIEAFEKSVSALREERFI